MQGPSLLPGHLAPYGSCSSDQDLFQALIQNLDDLLLFFECACEDEKWAQEHSKFLRLLLRWATKQFYLGNLSVYYARRIVKIIQVHYSVLQPYLFFQAALFFTVRLNVEDHDILVNSLLFGVCSPTLGNVFKRECFERLNDQWILFHVRLSTFRQIESYISKGELPELWKYEYEEIVDMMNQAKAWEIKGLVRDCAAFLHRYIHSDNVVETIIKAHQQGLDEWKAEAYAFFNQQEWGLRFLVGNSSDLKMEFLNFNLETLELFHLFAPWVTHLAFGGRLSGELEYRMVLSLCPRLVGVDLSGSDAYADQFAPLPLSLIELGLSACFWLRPDHLRKACAQCPQLKKLELANNGQLNSLAWGELHRFRQLQTLNLARCFQLTNEILKLIGQGCSSLSDLNVEECRSLENRGIFDIVMICPSLHELNLSYCDQLSDQALIEVALHLSQLTHLRIMKCIRFTDYGLQELVKLRPTLKYLNIQGCHFSLKVLESIQKTFPLLELEY